MKNNRKIYDGNFKARVVLEVIRGQKTISEIASEYGVHPNQIINWKKKVIEKLPEILSNSNGKNEKNGNNGSSDLEAELYRQIGQLKVELDWLKKNSLTLQSMRRGS
jgi:putative transposase